MKGALKTLCCCLFKIFIEILEMIMYFKTNTRRQINVHRFFFLNPSLQVFKEIGKNILSNDLEFNI